MRKAIELALLNTISYFVLTLDIRSVAQGNIPIAIIVNAILGFLSFTIVNRISKSTGGHADRIGYIIGGCIGVTVGILFSKVILGK